MRLTLLCTLWQLNKINQFCDYRCKHSKFCIGMHTNRQERIRTNALLKQVIDGLPDELFSGASVVRSNRGTRDVEEGASGDSELCRFSLERPPSTVTWIEVPPSW